MYLLYKAIELNWIGIEIEMKEESKEEVVWL